MISHFVLLPVLLLMSLGAHARELGAFMSGSEEVLVMDTRANRGAAAEYCANKEKCRVIEVSSREFANGNTFVQIDSSLANRNVVILAPEYMDTNTFMELLLEAHTAHTWAARNVEIVASSVPTVIEEGKLVLSASEVIQFMAQSGAQAFVGPNEIVDLRKVRSRQHVRPKSVSDRNGAVVISLNHEELGTQLAHKLNVQHKRAESLTMETLPKNQTVVVLSAMTIPTNANLFKSMQLVKKLKAAGNRVIQIVPYLPYVRSDKIDQPGVTVGGKLVADLLELAGPDIVGFVKLHAAQVQGFFTAPTLHIETRSSITDRLHELGIDAVVSPDAGFQKEATLYAGKLGLPVYVINKQRNPRTGEAELAKMGDFDVAGKILAVIDDETASGSTLVSSAEFLKSQGAAKVYAFVTHLAGDASKAIGNQSLDALYVSDTFPIDEKLRSEQVRVISVVDTIAQSLEPFVPSGCASLLESPQ